MPDSKEIDIDFEAVAAALALQRNSALDEIARMAGIIHALQKQIKLLEVPNG